MKKKRKIPQRIKSLEECINNSKEFITLNGICLLAFNAKPNKVIVRNYSKLIDLEISKMVFEINNAFFDDSNIQEKPFSSIINYTSWCKIKSSKSVKNIINYQRKYFSWIDIEWSSYETIKDMYENLNTFPMKNQNS